jgi:pimeloyl-ACP methyl ester carboxylesterase
MTRAALAPDDALPVLNGVIPPWPGSRSGSTALVTYVRRTPVSPGAEPALFVHGLGGSSLNWTDLAALLSDRLDGEAIDLPASASAIPPPRYSLGRDVRAGRPVDRARRPRSVHLFGNSLGGTIAVRVAATRPDLVRTLTLIPGAAIPGPGGRCTRGCVPCCWCPAPDRIATRRGSPRWTRPSWPGR